MVGSGPMTEGIAKGLLPDLIDQSWKSGLHLGAKRDTFGSHQVNGKICSDRVGAILSALLLIITGTRIWLNPAKPKTLLVIGLIAIAALTLDRANYTGCATRGRDTGAAATHSRNYQILTVVLQLLKVKCCTRQS